MRVRIGDLRQMISEAFGAVAKAKKDAGLSDADLDRLEDISGTSSVWFDYAKDASTGNVTATDSGSGKEYAFDTRSRGWRKS